MFLVAVPVNVVFLFPNEVAVNMPSRWDEVCLIFRFYKHAVPTGQKWVHGKPACTAKFFGACSPFASEYM